MTYLSVLQGNDFGPLLFLLYIAEIPELFQNVLVGYADDYTLFCSYHILVIGYLWQYP